MENLLTPIFLQLFCEKNSDGTKSLRLKGRELDQRKGVRLDCSDMMPICDFLNDNPDVVDLDICYNNIGDKGMYLFKTMYLKNENNMRHLNMASCSLTWKSIEQLYMVVDTLKLKTLKLTGNKLGKEGGRFIGMLLQKNNTITHLDLGDTDQTMASVPFLMTILRSDYSTNTSIRIFDMSRIIPSSLYYTYDSGDLAEHLGNMLKMNTTLYELHMQKCGFDGHDIERMLYGMKFNTTLIMLDLGNNQFGDHGVELIARWLRTRPPLLGLNVCGNSIKGTGCKALSKHLPFSKIRLLDISRNCIDDISIRDLLYTIKKPYQMRMLYMWGNNIGKEALCELDRLIKVGAFDPERLDVRIYEVDGLLYHAYVPEDHYKHRYYGVMDHGCAVELKIKRNIIEDEFTYPRNLTNFKYYNKIPAAPGSPRKPVC
ncbi:leucine-rich repeat-containing protein 34-like [Onthophagus taurus]|uniref:leucine-rich repeat-containing protein 34-like n=1 Tax=Onthophagus taurus TaxID=166361 RepID=UPI0039BE09B0